MSGEIDGIFANLDTTLRKFKREWGMEFMKRVKEKTPVVTGHLQNSWGFIEKQKDIEIYNTKDYAMYVEYGTDEFAPRAMMQTTILEADAISEVARQKAGVK